MKVVQRTPTPGNDLSADEKKRRAATWFASLRDRICADFERIVRHFGHLNLQQSLPPQLMGKHICVVCEQGLGDELFFLRYAPRLKALGARITYCASPKLAVGKIKVGDQIKALEMLGKIRANTAWNSVPVIMITTEGSQEKVMQALQLGASGYVRKPFTPDQIKEKLVGLV